MLTIILLILILFIPSFYISIKKDISIEKIIPCTIFSIILIIYLFGLINLLKFGIYFVFILSILFLILLVFEFINHNIKLKQLLKTILKPSIFIWISVIILLYFFYRGRMLVSWDEFSHWGDVVKMMYYNNIYNTNAASLSVARAYPPVMSIFQYFVENLSFNGFKEHYLFCAYQVFVISLILPFIQKIKWKEFFKIILVLIIILLAPTVFFTSPYFYYNIIYIDPFLGILFGYVMASIFIIKKYNKFEIISISLSLFALTLTKDIAPVFSFISLAFVFLNIVIADKNYRLLKKINKESLKKFFNRTKPVWIFFLVIFVSYFSWKINVLLNVKDINTNNPSTISDAIKAILHIDNTYRVTVVNNYIRALSNYRFIDIGNVYTISFVLIMYCIMFHSSEDRNNKKNSMFGFWSIFVGEILYVFLMLILYILMFSEYEATNLASFDRYIGIYLTAILYFIVLITIYRSIEQKKYKNLIVLLIIIILNSNISLVTHNIFNFHSNNESTYINRKNYIDAANSIRSKINKNEKHKFYIIVQNSTGMEKWMLRYEIRDIMKEINEGFNWSLGAKYSEGDIWTLNISKEEFKSILFKEDYDYIYLFRIDNQFIETYGELFDNNKLENDQLYKVNKANNKIEFVK